MQMEHRHTQRPSWTPSLYSTSAASTSSAPTSSSLAYGALRPPAYAATDSPYQPQPQYQNYHYPYSEAPRPPFAPLPPPPRDDDAGTSRLRYPPPSLPRPMLGGSLSPHIRLGDKLSPSAVATPAFSIAQQGGSTPKRASDEERRAKHREAQRRFVKRKKIEMTQLKQLAVELEKRHDLLQVVSEQEALSRENQTLLQQLESQQENTSTNRPVEDKEVVKPDEVKTEEAPQKDERPRAEIEWEPRTFEW